MHKKQRQRLTSYYKNIRINNLVLIVSRDRSSENDAVPSFFCLKVKLYNIVKKLGERGYFLVHF
jgi:hypothetical protein